MTKMKNRKELIVRSFNRENGSMREMKNKSRLIISTISVLLLISVGWGYSQYEGNRFWVKEYCVYNCAHGIILSDRDVIVDSSLYYLVNDEEDLLFNILRNYGASVDKVHTPRGETVVDALKRKNKLKLLKLAQDYKSNPKLDYLDDCRKSVDVK